MYTMKPIKDYILIEPVSKETTTASGIVIPDSVKEKPQEGIIIALGTGKFNEGNKERAPFEVKVGDTVMYKKWSGTEVKVNSKEMVLIKEDDILAIVS